ncbi:aspartate racemase/maleate isomerase family protein [Streptomyces pristinaespiralis]|uniref:aspartate racemase/maleate isomerase family protein n=1 Tax=Streptomyces pristinaespiralis TaxID=38300 RepID=UPI0037A4A24F
MWQNDGWNVRVRLGVLTPHADVGPESELRAMAPADVGIHAARVPFGAMRPGGGMDETIPLAPVRAFADPPYVDEATERLAAAPVAAIGFAFTSSAYVIGASAEEAMLERLCTRAGGVPVVATCAAMVDALHSVGASRLALVDPPWFDTELNALGRRYYQGTGFEVPFSAPCSLPSGQTLIQPADLYDWVIAHVPDSADAVVLGGNGFRAVGVIERLEARLERPVLTPNQVLLWAMLRAAGTTTDDVTGYGQLFSLAGPPPHE